MPLALGLALTAAVLSGAAALVYEVVWLRMLSLVVGHAVDALTAVLAAFMAGLALGAALFGRLAAQGRRPLRNCAWVELGIGASAAVLPWSFIGILPVALTLREALGLSYQAFELVQVGLAGVLVLLPTVLMGGTLPLLSQGFSGGETRPARLAGWLYTANTAGAVLGALATGYWLLPALGNHATGRVAGGANLLAAALLAVASRRTPAATPDPATLAASGRPPNAGGRWLVPAALAVSGAATMVFEVAWTRALTLILGSSTYAFTAVLVAVLLGLAGGSAAFVWRFGQRPVSVGVLAAVQGAIGVTATVVLLGFDRLPELLLVGLQWSDAASWVVVLELMLSTGALLLVTLSIGASFPCALAASTPSPPRIGQEFGRLYAASTLGAVAGVALGGLVLVPRWGIHGSLKAAILASLVMAGSLWIAEGGSGRRLVFAAAAGAMAFAVALLPPWDVRVMSAGPAIYARTFLAEMRQRSFREQVANERMVFYQDGKSGSVAVTEVGQHRILRVNGKVDASTFNDMPTQLTLAHLPLLVHPAPREVFVLGLGSGVTAAATLAHPVERVDVVELEPAVVEASRFFASAQGRSLDDPRLRIIVGDGRSFLRAASPRYDVIVSEPSNPWVRGMAGLFSSEFFALAKSRLRPGGVMLQWLHTYNLAPQDVRVVVATFRTSFPAATLWEPTPGDLLLLGWLEAPSIDLRGIRARWEATPAIRDDFARMFLKSWAGLLGFFVLDQDGTARLAVGAPLNTDDRLPLEWSAPRALYTNTDPANHAMLQAVQERARLDLEPGSQGELESADAQYWMAMGCLRRLATVDALAHFEKALSLDPRHVPAAVGASMTALKLGRYPDALAQAQRALAREPADPNALFFAGAAAWWLGRLPEAERYLERAVAIQPENSEFRGALARLRSGTLLR